MMKRFRPVRLALSALFLLTLIGVFLILEKKYPTTVRASEKPKSALAPSPSARGTRKPSDPPSVDPDGTYAVSPRLVVVAAGQSDGYPVYVQYDRRWKRQRIGGSRETIHAVGCTLCCASMALEYFGIHLPPDDLNRALIRQRGYSARGQLNWNVLSRVAGNRVEVLIPSRPSRRRIDLALSRGRPVFAKIRNRKRRWHWVLIVAKSNGEYLVKDPAGNRRVLESLADFHSRIYAIRILKKRDLRGTAQR